MDTQPNQTGRNLMRRGGQLDMQNQVRKYI